MNDLLRHLLTSDDSSSSSQNHHITHLNSTYNPPLSDLANARRFAAQFSNQVRFVPAYGWFLFDGRRWHLGDSDQVLALAAASLQSYYNEALSLTDKQTALCKRLLRHAERSQSLSHLNALLQIASTLPGISAQHTLFDADPYLLTVLNGTLDLRSGELLPHNSDHFITRLIPIEYDPQATSPIWNAFLARLTDSLLPMQHFLQCAFGYSLTGLTDHNLCFLLTGSGQRAQNLLLSLLRQLLGDYACHTPSLSPANLTPTLLTSRVLTTPVPALLTPRDYCTLASLIAAEPIPLDPTSPVGPIYQPHCKIWLSAPEPPEIPANVSFLHQSLTLIPISLSLSSQEISQLVSQLQTALPAILAWAVQGFQLWSTQGLPAPDSIILTNATYQSVQDDLSSFLELCCTQEPNQVIRAHELYSAYHLWSRSKCLHRLTETAFGRLMRARHFHRTRDATGNLYHGLALSLSLEQLAVKLANPSSL